MFASSSKRGVRRWLELSLAPLSPHGGPSVLPLMIFIRHEGSRQDSLEKHRQPWCEQVSFPDTTPDWPFEPELATRLPVPTCEALPREHF